MSISSIGESISAPIVASAVLPVSGHAGPAAGLSVSLAPAADFVTSGATAGLPAPQTGAVSATTPALAAEAVGSPAPAAPAPDPKVKTVADTVDLSQQAQIKLLSEQGQTPADIAARLGLNVSEVQGDLFISPTASAEAAAAAQAATNAKSATAAAEAAAAQSAAQTAAAALAQAA